MKDKEQITLKFTKRDFQPDRSISENMSELNPEQMICERCQKSVPAGPFCCKCGKEQSSPHENHNFGLPVQVTDSVGTDDSIEQTGGTASESHTKHSTMPRRTLSSPSTPEGVSANGNNDALYRRTSASFTVAMKPAGSSSQVEANIQSAVRTGVNDVNATEKLSKEANKVLVVS